MSAWTQRDMPDLSGRIAVVTGGNVGLGFASVQGLAARGARVVLACRRVDSGHEAVDRIRSRVPNASVEVLRLDLAEAGSISDFAKTLLANYDRLDILMNNAGVVNHPERVHTPDGHELQMATNHFGHFALTGRLFDRLCNTEDARVVVLSSAATRAGEIRFDDLDWRERTYDRLEAYGDSKLANLHFMVALQRRFESHGVQAIAVAAHPGLAGTERQQSVGVGGFVTRWLASPVEHGVRSQLRAATDPGVRGGDYYGPRFSLRGPATNDRREVDALEDAVSERLWRVSEETTGVVYPAA